MNAKHQKKLATFVKAITFIETHPPIQTNAPPGFAKQLRTLTTAAATIGQLAPDRGSGKPALIRLMTGATLVAPPESERDGVVEIRRRDGTVFLLKPAPRAKSPLDVPGVSLKVGTEELVAMVREGRQRTR